ncbi:helix-turn-helix domain-containing protein [Pseudonocardia sp. NPDC049635]|uniref:TetR/AcrR family transcriptional regulator n=1 Tax=Pseudonocardia sp. NPDC049635 TaxID=3155506 RepID=UPI0033F2420A
MAAESGAPPLRSGDATRRALLAAAADLFAEHGYDRTPVRAIAERAGVNQALLFRYFGSKEALFARVAAERALAVLHGGPPEELLERTIRSIFDSGTGPEHDLFGSVVRSAGTSEAAAAVRVELLLAWLLGLSLVHPVLPDGSIGRSTTEDLLTHVRRTATALLDGPLDR